MGGTEERRRRRGPDRQGRMFSSDVGEVKQDAHERGVHRGLSWLSVGKIQTALMQQHPCPSTDAP